MKYLGAHVSGVATHLVQEVADVRGEPVQEVLKQIVGTLAPTHGEVRIGGLPHHVIRRYGEDSLYEILAYAEQHPKINQKPSIRDNLLAFTPSLHVGDAEIRALLTSLGLSPLAADLDRPIGHPLSGGELTRFGLAKALIRRPKILLLDEPTGPLDQKTARNLAAPRRPSCRVPTPHDDYRDPRSRSP